ncbi:glycoside hydrolase family 16 protein [Acetobacteroides hydrogenigenes]|uniref:Glycosyl hydrolase family 16 n=1 Tax=Acetobacteroides hydrogenigenes TaxID=979970 RepID=A0A4R2ED07_9BACT|nr:glycoside hydrolase family 16 protein [Acetobacteroides hydrogenigenes]TCN64742.1 glycosyl hydrolase family 16 [Acetobacteroides hydrogenigenes]
MGLFKRATIAAAVLLVGFTASSQKQEHKWKLTWQDDFNGTRIDTSKWSKIPRGGSDWNRHMSDQDSLYEVKDGKLLLRGMVNTNPTDTVPVVTGGVYTKGKFFQKYGRIEISAKLQSAQGAWPAFWMLPETGKWPNAGEIDIMEHLNFDSIAYQTVHSYYTFVLKEENPPKGGVNKINMNEFNTYRVDWYPDSLVFFVNNRRTFAYPRIETTKEGQWPFTTPFYLLLDMQLGGSWVGPIDKSQLPVEMEIDWIKFYALPKEFEKEE